MRLKITSTGDNQFSVEISGYRSSETVKKHGNKVNMSYANEALHTSPLPGFIVKDKLTFELGPLSMLKIASLRRGESVTIGK